LLQRDAIRGLAGVALINAAGFLLLSILNIRAWLLYAQPKWWPPLLLMSIYCGTLGVGMLHRRKWAVALFVISALAVGISLLIGSILSSIASGNVWVLANVPLGVALCLPLIPAILSWPELT